MNYAALWEQHWPWLVYFWATWALFGAGIGRRADQGGTGLILGLLLGPFGVALAYAWLWEPPRQLSPRAAIGRDPEALQRFLEHRPVSRPSDVDRAGPFVPPEGSTAEDRDRWAQQMQQLANDEMERRKGGQY